MSNRDPNPGGKSQVERLQIECFLDAHVPSSQTNRHDSPHSSGSKHPTHDSKCTAHFPSCRLIRILSTCCILQ